MLVSSLQSNKSNYLSVLRHAETNPNLLSVRFPLSQLHKRKSPMATHDDATRAAALRPAAPSHLIASKPPLCCCCSNTHFLFEGISFHFDDTMSLAATRVIASRTLARRAPVAQQKRQFGFIDYLTNYPDKVRRSIELRRLCSV